MTTSSSQVNSKRAIKRKLDESVLQKARAALGLPLESRDDDEKDEQSDQPSLKWRKPRHNTAEGQLYMQNKQKRKLEEDKERKVQTPRSSLASSLKKTEKKSKKKRKSKKKKADDESGPSTSIEQSKNPESEQRHAMEAISYLQLWAANRDHWKFEKRKQTWLLKNCLNASLIDDKRFELLLEYAASVKGAARKATLDEMQSIVKKNEIFVDNEKKIDSQDEEGSATDVMYERARQVIQMLGD